MSAAQIIALISDPTSPPADVLKAADELISRNLVYVNSGSNSSDEMVQGILHALIKVALNQGSDHLS